MQFTADHYKQNLECDAFRYLALDTEDSRSYAMYEKFDEIVAFLRQCREEGKPVLIHCMMGLNRAACACVVFLMREGLELGTQGLGLREAVDWVSRRRAG